jgi:hypothetical protein
MSGKPGHGRLPEAAQRRILLPLLVLGSRRYDATSGAVDKHRAKGLPRVIWTSQIRASAARCSANTRKPQILHVRRGRP